MYSITFKCKIVTPLYSYGADGKTPEIRPSSIKGLLRFWWRAIKNDTTDLKKLKETENKIFGGSGEKEGKSNIRINIFNKKLNIGDNLKTDENLSWHFDKKLRRLLGHHKGISFVLYSVNQYKQEKKYIKPGSTFYIRITSFDVTFLNIALASFWTLVFIGNIGSRSRRGAGSISVTEIIDKQNILKNLNIDFIPNIPNDDLSQFILNNFKNVKNIINSKPTQFIDNYSNLSISRIILSSSNYDSYINALNDIGNNFEEFRFSHRKDFFDTAVFGLPIVHSDKSTIQPYDISNEEYMQRRSSPLIIKILLINNKYYWILTRLAGEFLPKNIILAKVKKINKQKTILKTQKPDFSLFDEFWNKIKKQNTEYILSTPANLDEIKKKIISELNPSKMILFGSKARGDFTEKSDTDVAVETNKSINLANINGNIDLINLNSINSNFKQKIMDEGITL